MFKPLSLVCFVLRRVKECTDMLMRFFVCIADFGKRPVFVLASGLLCACYAWGAMATSFESLLWSNIVAAFAGSSTEALGAATVNVSVLSRVS
jgi:hypothetical protein